MYFPDLPYHIKRRLTYNPQTRELTFAGVYDTSAEFGGVDNPLLLPNVMSPREFDRIKALANDSTWNGQIKELFELTRNPNRVDLSPRNGQPDAALRLGLTMSGTDVVLEKFGSGPKALTAGLGGIPPAEPRPLQALNFTGTTNRISLSSFSALAGDFTISVWAQVAANNTGALITNSVANGGSFHFVPQPGANRFVVSDRTNAGPPGIVAHAFDTSWHHYALVREFTNLTVLVDGVPVGNTRAYGLADTSGFRIGEGFRGQLDEFQIRNVALTPADIRRTMRKQLNGREDGLSRLLPLRRRRRHHRHVRNHQRAARRPSPPARASPGSIPPRPPPSRRASSRSLKTTTRIVRSFPPRSTSSASTKVRRSATSRSSRPTTSSMNASRCATAATSAARRS